nr:MAG TPA: hypothetical protein [Caudoviricetes sp.]
MPHRISSYLASDPSLDCRTKLLDCRKTPPAEGSSSQAGSLASSDIPDIPAQISFPGLLLPRLCTTLSSARSKICRCFTVSDFVVLATNALSNKVKDSCELGIGDVVHYPVELCRITILVFTKNVEQSLHFLLVRFILLRRITFDLVRSSPCAYADELSSLACRHLGDIESTSCDLEDLLLRDDLVKVEVLSHSR